MAKDVENRFMCLLVICISGEMLIQILCLFLNWFVFLLPNCKNSLYILLDMTPLTDQWLTSIFIWFCGSSFHFFKKKVILHLWTKLVEVTEFQLSYFKSWKMMLWKCCTQYAIKFGKLSSGHRTGKGKFSFQPQRKAIPKNAQTTALLLSSHTLVK